jgi:hypothetical protein
MKDISQWLIMMPGVQSNPERGSKLITFLSINMTFLASIIFMLYQLKNYLNIWTQYIISLILILDFVIIIYAFFYDKIYYFLSQSRSKWKRNRLARKHFSELRDIIDIFRELTEDQNSIPKVFDDLRSGNDKFKYLIVPNKNEIINLLIDLQKSMKRFDRTAEDFEHFNDQMRNIIKIYNEFWINRPIIDVKLIVEVHKDGSIPENIKKKYDSSRGKYEKFLVKYEEFGKKVNKQFGGDIINTYFDIPKEL